MTAAPTVHLVDASIYVFRAYFSVTPEFVDLDQRPVHAVFGFLNMLLNLLHEEQPTHIAVCFDQFAELCRVRSGIDQLPRRVGAALPEQLDQAHLDLRCGRAL